MLPVRDSSHAEENPVFLSDNGTKILGTARENRRNIADWNLPETEKSLAQKQMKWKFNPPGAPDFGGVWERMVRSCKKTMVSVVGNRTLTYDVLSITMCLVKQILSSRPLSIVSDDPQDLEALTPHHLLLGRSCPATQFIPNAQGYMDLRRIFRVSQVNAGMIWSIRNRENLPSWNQRSKCNKKELNNWKSLICFG